MNAVKSRKTFLTKVAVAFSGIFLFKSIMPSFNSIGKNPMKDSANSGSKIIIKVNPEAIERKRNG